MSFTAAETELIDSLKGLLHFFTQVPVYDEVGLPCEVSGSRTKVKFTYENWRTDLPIKIHLNDAQGEITSGTDYVIPNTLDGDGDATTDGDGTITLLTSSGSTFETSGELEVGHEIEASYSFRYFTDTELLCFLELALKLTNNWPPLTTYGNVNDMPREFDGAVIIGAYFFALQRVLMDANFWNQGIIWMDKAWLQGTLQTQYAESSKRFDQMSKNAKPRSFAKPRGVTSGRFSTQSRVTGSNFTSFIVA